jgi:hypothetical protein
MQNHYEIVRDVRKRMRLAEQITPDELIDYYWSLHRLHEHQAQEHQIQISGSQNGQAELHKMSRDRHYRKAHECRTMAEEFEEKAYPGLSRRIGEISEENLDEKSDYQPQFS